MIDSYEFGKIVINGKMYSGDVVVSGRGVRSNWWRKEGHLLRLEDIQNVLEDKPDILIIGTGFSGVLNVPKYLERQILSMGIELIVKRTREACNEYNKLFEEKEVVAALHLTC